MFLWTENSVFFYERLVTVFVVTVADMNTRKWNFLLEDYPKLSE